MTHINQRRDTAANWTATNPILHDGEVGWERDTGKAKMGDGSTAWTGLGYLIDAEVDSVNGQTGVVVLDKGDVGLGNVDNTPDANKPVSADQQDALDLKADLVSPALTGTPTAPTPAVADNDTSIATTAFVRGELDAVPAPDMIVFSVSGTFSKASYPGLKAVRVRVLAGGGAGGGSETTAAGESSAGAGGGSGGYSESIIAASALEASETVTVGAGGAGVLGGAGNNGSGSSFGTHVTANGGPGGITMPTGTNANAGAFSAQAGAGTGEIATPGAVGGAIIRVAGIQSSAGAGGNSVWGGGGRGIVDTTSNGGAGSFGSGGGGAQSRSAGTSRTGGAGGNGRVIVDLFF